MRKFASGVLCMILIITFVVFCGCSKKKSKDSNVIMPPTDTTAPITTADPGGGTFGSAISVNLTSDETGLICYTTDGSTPTTTHHTGSGPNPIYGIPISTTTTLKFFAIDGAGNEETVKTEEYIIGVSDTTPPVITSGPTISGVGNVTATIGWTTDEVSDSVVEYGLDASYGQSESDAADVTSHGITLVGLTPDTTYHYRVGSTDPSGNGPTWSADLTFKTTLVGDTTPPVITSGPTATGVTGDAATIEWTTDEVSDSVVEYGLDTGYGQSESDAADVTNHSVALTGLSESTTYHFRVGSTDPSGNGPTWSGDFTFTTTGAGPPTLTITTSSLPAGTVGGAYSAKLTATGGTPSYTWSNSGALPSGLSLDSATGEIAGDPAASGTYNFTAEVADSGAPQQNATKNLSITIAGAEITVTIGTGDKDKRYPLECWYGFGRCQMLYLKSEIESGGGAAGEITKIRFNKVSGAAWTYGTCDIHLGHTAETQLETPGTWQSEGTLVYNGNLAVPASNGWFEVVLETPFIYNNSENLLVSVRHQTGSTNLAGPEWACSLEIFDPDLCLEGHSDTANPPGVSSTSYRPNIQLVINIP